MTSPTSPNTQKQNQTSPNKADGGQANSMNELSPERLAEFACLLARGSEEQESAASLVQRAIKIWYAANQVCPLAAELPNSDLISFEKIVRHKMLPARRGGEAEDVGTQKGLLGVIKNYFEYIREGFAKAFKDRNISKNQIQSLKFQLEGCILTLLLI